jgi:photosystem II stability/assembly factor-like uncharacterized protein
MNPAGMICLETILTRILSVSFALYAATLSADQQILHLEDRENIPVLSRALFLDLARAGNHIVAAGERGHILVSQDGERWQMAEVPADSTLTALYFHNERLGWAAGHDAVILKTADGGRHWRKVYAAPEEEIPLLDIWFADDHYGIAIGAYGLYLVTTDGGDTWTRQQMNVVNADAERSDDLAESYELHLNSIACSSSGKLYIAAEAGRIYRSDDLGKNWKELPSPYTGSFFGILPLGHESVLVYGLRGHLYRSEDNGESWLEINSHTRELLTGGIRMSDGRVLLTGMGGVLLISDDHGRSFRPDAPGHRHSYAAVAESVNNRIILAGDHGIELRIMQKPGTAHD